MENIILKKLKLSIVSGLVNKLVGELTKSRANHAQKKVFSAKAIGVCVYVVHLYICIVLET